MSLQKRGGAQRPQNADRGEPLSERRFEELLKKASEFFAAEERDPEAEKQAAIQEILCEMRLHGLTADDLLE